jgi:hypothetical protein
MVSWLQGRLKACLSLKLGLICRAILVHEGGLAHRILPGHVIREIVMKTAVVLAYNSSNTGMYSVDISALQLFSKLEVPVDFLVGAGLDSFGWIEYGNIRLRKIKNPDILAGYDNIVYWGDFTTSPHYGIEDYFKLIRHYDGINSREHIFERWQKIHLLKDIDKGSRRIFSFGQNFQTLSHSAAQLNLASLASYYERFDAIMPRDSHSCDELKANFPTLSPGRLTMGSDCAFLLDHTQRRERSGRTGQICMVLGRSKVANFQPVIDRLAGQGYKFRYINRWLDSPANNFNAYYEGAIRELRSSDAVITDTYHFAINAIREGVTPVVLARAETGQTSTVGDFKKKVLLRDLVAEDLLAEFHGDGLNEEEVNAIVTRVGEIIDSTEPHGVHEAAREQGERAKDNFKRVFLD